MSGHEPASEQPNKEIKMSNRNWRVTFHNGETLDIEAGEIRIDEHGGVGFWDDNEHVANVAPGCYRSVAPATSPETAD